MKTVARFCVGVGALLLCGCSTVRKPQTATRPHFQIVTYNVNRGSSPGEIAEVIRTNAADIVCLQEVDNLENGIRAALSKEYRTIEFHDSEERVGGGLIFLSKFPAREIVRIPTANGWFDGWVMAFETPLGPVQVLNVHLQPPYGRWGGWVGGYFTTRGDRLREIKHFYSYCDPKLPLIVVGDFNDTSHSRAVRFLKRHGLKNALPQFDRHTPTWYWPTRLITLRRRMDHILYSSELECASARVILGGPSDHFPVEALFTGAGAKPK
jgi:endonuclease/exonuclease/phosphatase family metal-dependent hydrolase